MISKEMYDNGLRCKGKGFNCPTCKDIINCVEYEKPTKLINIKNKRYRIEEDPIDASIIVTNEKRSFFRAYRGQKLDSDNKKYVAYIYEIVEEL